MREVLDCIIYFIFTAVMITGLVEANEKKIAVECLIAFTFQYADF